MPAQMTAHLEPLLAALARAGQTPSVTYAKLIAYKQGNRGLISYEVTGTEYGEQHVVFGKLYPELNQAERVCQTMQALRDALLRCERTVGVPRALGCIPDLSMLVYIPAEGQLLGDALAHRSGAPLHGYVWRVAGHAAPLPAADREAFPAGDRARERAKPGRCWWAISILIRPRQHSEIAKQLQDHASEMAFDTQSPIHKDFHYGHIVVNGGLKVIDFDEMRLGDPNFDLAHFCANLHLRPTG